MSYSFSGCFYNRYKPLFPYKCKDYSFNVDLQYGDLIFTKRLLKLSGKHLPLELSLKYIQRHTNVNDNFHLDSGFPKGFKTNYHVFLEYDSTNDKYNYEDLDGFLHIFELAYNSSTLYYDSLGSGLMLVTTNDGFKVFDDDGNYQLFDQAGRLKKIHKKVTATHYTEQSINYYNDLMISSIVDNYGQSIYFNYSGGQSIQISYNNVIIITVYSNNYRLTNIYKYIGGDTVEDTFVQPGFVQSLSLATGESLSFSYLNDKVSELITNMEQDAFHFDYDQDDNKWAKVSNARGISTRLDFDEEGGSFSQTSNENVDLGYLRINSDIVSCLAKTTTENNEVTLFTHHQGATFSFNSHEFGYSDYVTNNFLKPCKMYLFCVEIESSFSSNEYLQLRLRDFDNHCLAELVFKSGMSVLAYPVGIRASTQKTFRIEYLNLSDSTVIVHKARLIPLFGDFEMICTNVNTEGSIFYYGDTPYRFLKNGNVSRLNGNSISNLGYTITSNDYLKNEKLYYKRNGTFHFWCNNGKKLIDNVSSVFVEYEFSNYIGYDASLNYIGYYDSVFELISNVDFYIIKGKDDNSFSSTKISHNNSDFHTGYTSFYYEEVETTFVAGNTGYITYCDYNENYSLMELNRDDGYQEVFDYDSHANLEVKAAMHSNITGWLYKEYFYDSNDNLEYEEDFVDDWLEETSYTYNQHGNVSEIIYPNSYKNAFSYDNATEERITCVSFGQNNSYDFSQNNNYIDEDNYSFSTINNTYSIALTNGKVSSVSYNNQQILTITYHDEIYGSLTLYSSETLTYSNGGSIYTEYDEYNRLSIVDGVKYIYDDFSNIVSIHDGYYNQTYPTVLNSYDYYNNLISAEHRYNGLRNTFRYDIYKRLVFQSFFFDNGNDPEYTVEYTYFDKPTLENVAKKSRIIHDTTIIEIIDESDAFSRSTSQKVQIGNHFINQNLTYCEDSGSTNFLVKTVTHYDENTYPGPPVIFDPSLYTRPIVDTYSYDSVGNITSIISRQLHYVLYRVEYEYDCYSRLVRENNQLLDKTYTYEYDNDGNITSKKEYAYTTNQTPTNPISTISYSYDATYPNRLTAFGSQTCAYDSVGNPTTYRGKSMYWVKGTLLSQVQSSFITTDLTYDGLGQRVMKTVTGLLPSTTNYDYNNNLLIRERRGTKTIKYLYSHRGIIGFVLEGFNTGGGLSPSNIDGTYFFEKNIQQDVISIRNINNVIVASYVYDAWGNHVVKKPDGTVVTSSSFIGNVNPIRYRSYYYDADLKMYWLTTRYYDPEVGRFISPDHYSYLDFKKLHGINLYAYSKNNPVMYFDPSGHLWIEIFSAIIAVVITAVMYVVAADVVHEKMAANRTEIIAPSGEEVDKEGYHHENSTGVDFWFYVKKNIENPTMSSIKILNSWQYSRKEMKDFLDWLSTQYEGLNVRRMLNEWKWHNIAYTLNIRKKSTKDVDMYFDAPDEHYSFIFDLFWLW